MKEFLALGLMFTSLLALASSTNPEFNDITNIEVFEVNNDNNLVEVRSSNIEEVAHFYKRSANKDIGKTLIVARDLLAFGKEIYKIIDAGKPVVTIADVEAISVMPKTDKGEDISALDLEFWQVPRSKKFKVVATNGFGFSMISFEFLVIFAYGGSHNGKGKYITGAEISATDVTVGWGYDLDANFKLQSIFNTGSNDDPVAAAILEISYTMKTVIKEARSTKKFLVDGLGQIKAY